MKNMEKESLAELARLEKQFASLYRIASSVCGLPDCTFWVLYFLHSSKEPLAQQDLIERMRFPKQTINSAVQSLSRSGHVTLAMIPGTRNRKRITLTAQGKALARQTVGRLIEAEANAVRLMGAGKMREYIALHDEFLSLLKSEFADAGLAAAHDAKEGM